MMIDDKSKIYMVFTRSPHRPSAVKINFVSGLPLRQLLCIPLGVYD